MSYRLANISSICLLLATSLAAQPTESTVPTFGEEIIVLGDLPFIYPVETGRPILIRFGIGEIDIESSDRSEILAELGVTCSAKLSDALCEKYRQRLRLEPRETDEGVEVRLVGLSKFKLRKLNLHGRVEVPRWSPLAVKIGIGEVDIRTDTENLTVQMGIGDLTIRVPEERIASVSIGTRIGDASVRGTRGYFEGGRRMLIGSRVHWDEGDGTARIEVGLKIGDAKVVLE